MAEEPNPNKYKSVENYVKNLKNHWARHGGPSNQKRAIQLRLLQFWEAKRENKMNLANEIRNMQNEFHRETSWVGKRYVSNSNNNSNSKSSHNTYINTRPKMRTNIQELMNKIQKAGENFYELEQRLKNITKAIGKRKGTPERYYTDTYKYLKKEGIEKEKARIRRRNSRRTLEKVFQKVNNELPPNIAKHIRSLVPTPTFPLKITPQRYLGELIVYKNADGRYWVQDRQGRWRLTNKSGWNL